MTNPFSLSGHTHLDNFIVTRKSCPLTGPDSYRDVQKRMPALTRTATNPHHRAVIFKPLVRLTERHLDFNGLNITQKASIDRKTCLSKMIESYLDSVTKPDSDDIEITPLVKCLVE
jgi:hypothetical protein